MPYTKAAKLIQTQQPLFEPKVGIILGSGLSNFASCLQDPISIAYDSLPGFPKLTVNGHHGEMILGSIDKTEVVCLKGRTHSYEGTRADTIKTYIRTLRLLGCRYLIATNASGSLHMDMPPGSLMLITDHINFQGTNPLVGPNDDEFGPRFFPLDNAYDKKLNSCFLNTAKSLEFTLHQGIYACVMGPNYETAAEIRAFRILGADAVGMSTVPEVLVANHCGMQVAAIAVITNLATGLSEYSHSHEDVLNKANLAAKNLTTLLTTVIPTLP